MAKEIEFAVRKVITTHDPEDLLQMGAPQDEYDPEIRDISDAIENYHPRSPREIANIVALVWFWHFGDWSEPMQFYSDAWPIAMDIWNEMLEIEAGARCSEEGRE